MGYKEDALNLYRDLNNRAPHQLKCGDDLYRLIEIAYQFDMKEELEQLAFSGKFSHGLFQIIQKGGAAVEEEYFEKIKKEYTESLIKLRKDLEIILDKSTDFFRKIFKEKYFTLTHESMFNLSELCSDLNHLKMYMNDMKRR